MIIKKLVLPGLILAYVYAKGYEKASEKDTVKHWWHDIQWNPSVDKTELKRWWRGNFQPWNGNFEPWSENNGGEDFIVFPGGRFGAWGDRIFIKRKNSLTDHAQFNFTVSLLQKLALEGKSVILSPLSVSTSLFMIYLAANGKTKQQLENVLGGTASTPEVRLHFAKLLRNIENAENENYTLRIANRLYVRQEFHTKESFARMIQYYFDEVLHNFNYGEKNKFVQEINEWISEKTNNKITELITADSVSDDVKMLLLNAIHFKGTWKTQFMKAVTKRRDFYISENKTKKVPMMTTSYSLPYYEDDFVQVVKLPFVGNEIEMIFILPKIRFGLSDVLKNLTGSDLIKYIHNAKPKLSSLRIPRFELKGKLNLKETLENIGITDAFNRIANFEELTEDKISVGNIMHAGFIAVDEKGTESAAATVIELIDRISASKYFNADQPFLFAIVKNLKTILFAGQFS